MNICSENHDEICFEGRTCPACFKIEEILKDLEDARARILELEELIEKEAKSQ